MRRLWREGVIRSRFGWPVPRVAKEVSSREISTLVDAAKSSGLSRKGSGLVVQEGWCYYLLPYLQESSPVPCWMCVVAAVKNPAKASGVERVELHYSRLDVAIDEFQSLRNAAAVDRDRLLHWVLWDAVKSVGEKGGV
ncbi:hypothetical protein O7628_20895 [Micromonospora sp. WMMD956]|uniref:hypothetical protein n=1 Tax=Micromonospora sp. WMMD956 TaxID=3016108 RepID=UPI0024172E6E|nr:hypothetical protein [Micromonospora sp. WMMD956]MDG4817950.1 hypothetical protein [Micromonospora sp. WMMD956]